MRKLMAGLLIGAIASTGWTQVDPNRVVAVVNGEEIKGAEYFRRMEYLPGTGQMLGNRFAEFPPGFMTIEQIITERLVYALAKQKHCMPSDAEIQAELDRAKAGNPKIVDQWLASGRLMEDLLNQFKFELAEFKLATNGVTVTDQQVDDHYKQNLDTEFTIPKRVKLRVIVVTGNDQRAAVDQALASGMSFADAASKFSIDVTKADGGLYGVVPEAGLQEPAKSALQNLAVGKTTDWLSVEAAGATQSLKFLKEDVYASKVLPMDASLREQVRRKLMLDKAKANGTNTVAKDMADMRRSAKIDIKNPDFATAYQKFIEGYLKQQDAKINPGN